MRKQKRKYLLPNIVAVLVAIIFASGVGIYLIQKELGTIASMIVFSFLSFVGALLVYVFLQKMIEAILQKRIDKRQMKKYF